MSTHPQAEMISRADYALTVVPIGILAFIVTDVAHEVIGRGAGYFLAGGKSGILTTTRLIADQKLGEMGSKIFDLGSPAGNLTFAFLAWMAQRLFRRPAPRLRFFLCMVMAFNLF